MENSEGSSKTFVLKCTRCGTGIETTTAPGPKSTGFLCVSCHMKWLDIEKKLDGHVYADEKRDAFIKFINDLVYLRNHTLGR